MQARTRLVARPLARLLLMQLGVRLGGGASRRPFVHRSPAQRPATLRLSVAINIDLFDH
jgi:hypothetical protein